jgi:hypothetical protein
VAAARLADIGAADPDPRVALRGDEEVGEKFAVGLLDQGALGKGAVGFGEARRKRVADFLQLTEVEDARWPGGVDPVRDLDPAHALGEEAAQLEIQLGDLPTQLDPGASLVEIVPSSLGRPLGYKGKTVDLSLVEQIYHEQILSRLEGRGGNP